MYSPRHCHGTRIAALVTFCIGLPLDDMDNGVEANHLVMACTIVDNHNEIRSHVLIDSGATGDAFIDKAFAARHNFPLFELKEP